MTYILGMGNQGTATSKQRGFSPTPCITLMGLCTPKPSTPVAGLWGAKTLALAWQANLWHQTPDSCLCFYLSPRSAPEEGWLDLAKICIFFVCLHFRRQDSTSISNKKMAPVSIPLSHYQPVWWLLIWSFTWETKGHGLKTVWSLCWLGRGPCQEWPFPSSPVLGYCGPKGHPTQGI